MIHSRQRFVRVERWSRDNAHAVLARRFAERYTSDERLLSTLELHDEPYWIWRNDSAPRQRLQRLLTRLPDLELFARFIELDAANEGKDLTFLWWFRRELAILNDGNEDVVYVKAFATSPEQQAAVANAATELVAEQRAGCRPTGRSLPATMDCASCCNGTGMDLGAI